MRILIPMAGEGSRFADKGYTFPKPLIDVGGKPMIQRVIDDFPNEDAHFIFLVRKSHVDEYGMDEILSRAVGDRKCSIVTVDKLTEGAACTALLAKDLIDNDDELIIANSDQHILYSTINFNCLRFTGNPDGIVFTFYATHPKWSFAKCDGFGVVSEVAEKKPISNVATCGVYYYRRGRDFVRYAEQMIEKNIRVNGEFYIAPVYNEMIADGDTLVTFFVDEMYGLGTPEDLELFLNDR